MSSFLKEVVSGEGFELLIDTSIFPKDIVLKSAYNFLNKGYFFFRYDENKNMILEFTAKPDTHLSPKQVILEFSDELLDVYLRDKLEKDNRVIREIIVSKSLLWPLDSWNYVSHDPNNPNQLPESEPNKLTSEPTAEIDFDKDIDDIIKEIENDPDLQIDEDEIQQMLREIEEETAQESSVAKPNIVIDPSSISDAKKMFD